jgi:hypothetical protein
MNRTRDWRRSQNSRKENRVYKKLRNFSTRWGTGNICEDIEHDRLKAKVLRDHLKNCSCYMCGNPRKFWNERTMQERIFDEIEKTQDLD